MPDMIDMINFAIAVSGITVSVLGLTLAMVLQYGKGQIRRFFLFVFAVLIAYTVSDLISQISLVFLGPGYSALSGAAIFGESFFSSLLMPMFTIYLLRRCGESLNCRLFHAVSLLWGIYISILVFTQFTTVIYYVSDDNIYRRGPYYPLLLIPTVLLMLATMIGLYRRKSYFTTREWHSFWLYLLIPTVSILIQMTSYSILFILLGTSAAGFLMFIFLLNDQVEKNIRQSIEIRSLQIRPHFIYNTMSNIYYLCELDPKKAQKVVGDFTTYLRNNLSAVASNELIPFENELEHTRAYLAVTGARYGDQVITEFDISIQSFRLPPLLWSLSLRMLSSTVLIRSRILYTSPSEHGRRKGR